MQHGAMDFSVPPLEPDEVRLYRLNRVRAELQRLDYAAIVLYDPINTRYATDVTNMQVWSMHNEQRYVLVMADGPVFVFEGESATHLAKDLPTVDEIRPATSWYYFAAGERSDEMASKWAAEIADLVTRHGAGNRRLAIDRAGVRGLHELRILGFKLFDGFEVMEIAREIKSEDEIKLIRCAISACEAGIQTMREALSPGITENQLWARLHEANIALGGEWIETRLLSSGQRTNPWYQECSHRVIEASELVAFDTDLIGPYGYCGDISRTWLCGDQKPSDEQRRLYALAAEQICINLALLRPGTTFLEFAESAWRIPDKYLANRYSCLGHGVGLSDEYPSLTHLEDFDELGYDAVLKAGMVICVESYMGLKDGMQGVKLEEQVLVTDNGPERLSTYPLEEDWL